MGGDGEIYRRGHRTTGGFGLRGPLSDAGPRSPMINWWATLASPRGDGGRGSCHLSRGVGSEEGMEVKEVDGLGVGAWEGT